MTSTKRNRFLSPITLACVSASLFMACGEVVVGNPADAPTIVDVTPARASVKGITEITVTGSGFSENTQIIIGATRVTGITVDDEATLRFLAPANTEFGEALDLQIFNDNGFALAASSITYNTPPVYGSSAPRILQLAGGETITITGEHFEEGTSPVVEIGGAAATDVVVVDSQTITALSPSVPEAGVAVPLDIVVKTENGDSVGAESGLYLGKGLFFGTSRAFVEGHGLHFIDPATSRHALVVPLVSSVARFFREPDGEILARFGNQGDAPLGANVYGRIDLDTGEPSSLVAFRREGTNDSIRTRGTTSVGPDYFAVSNNGELGRFDRMTEEFISILSLPGQNSSRCLVPGPMPGTILSVGNFNENSTLVDIEIGTATDLPALNGDITEGSEVRCHGGTVLDGVFYAIQYDRTGGGTTLVTIDPPTGVVSFIADLPTGASGLLATENGR